MNRLLLPLVALALIAGVLGVQLAYGGGSYEPLRPADPCVPRAVASESDGLEALTEELVLIALDDAACTLGTSREALTLDLAGSPTQAESEALHDGLLVAVERLDAEDALPPSSELVDEALDATDLNRFVEAAIRALPDSLVDSALPTDEVLTRAVGNLDVDDLLADLDDPGDLNAQVEAAVTEAVKDTLVDRVRGLV